MEIKRNCSTTVPICGYNIHFLRFCSHCFENSNIDYGYYLQHAQNCFGCVGMHHVKYCILNKQYGKEEYFELKEKIIAHMEKTGEWGEFFPLEISPFCYNETVAYELFPLSQEEVIKRGWKWREEELGTKYDGPQYTIPERIEDVTDEILQKILTCEKTGKNYRLVKPELEFYRKMKLPVPRVCPEVRHEQKRALRNLRQLWSCKCDKCGEDIETTFSPDRPEKVYCEKCYLESVN